MDRSPITLAEIYRHKGWCSRGMRAFASNHGFDWLDFVNNGVSIEALEATGDAQALEVVELVLKDRGL